jgi:hypothetical protein
MNQLEIINQSVLRMIALQLCLEQVWEPLYLQPRYNRKGTLSGIPKHEVQKEYHRLQNSFGRVCDDCTDGVAGRRLI